MSNCPVCRCDIRRDFLVSADMYTGVRHKIDRCGSCGLARTTDDGNSSTVDLYLYGGCADAGRRFGPIQWLLRAFRRARVCRLGVGGRGCAIDVGCGDGAFLEALAREGWEVYGTELSNSIAATARERFGDRIRVGSLQEAGFAAASFDLITFWHVLEHLDAPDRALTEARRLLKPEGRIVVAVPNIDSWQARVFREDWLHLDVPRHRWHFSLRTLATLAERCELQVDCVRHFSLEYGPVAVVQGIATKLGLGHVLFTQLLRESPTRLVHKPSFWAHMLVATFAAVPSLLFEVAGALCGRGGTIEVVLRPIR